MRKLPTMALTWAPKLLAYTFALYLLVHAVNGWTVFLVFAAIVVQRRTTRGGAAAFVLVGAFLALLYTAHYWKTAVLLGMPPVITGALFLMDAYWGGYEEPPAVPGMTDGDAPDEAAAQNERAAPEDPARPTGKEVTA